MTWLPDHVVDRLRVTLGSPDLSGTRYRAVRLLGRGGMAGVWLAEDTVLHRQVALKVLDLADGEEGLAARLLQEAEILASLEHPGIVPVHDAGTLADGRVFCCMKWVRGETLEQHVRGLTSVSEGLRLILRVAEPLAFAHSRGVLHRDLKPGNIMFGAFGEVLVVDWGLAKRVHASGKATGAAPVDPGVSESGGPDPAATGIVGTPGFMSPEQARGETATARSDIFSLGAVMAFTLANSASEGKNSLPRQVKAICGRAMAADPAARYESVEALAADISKYLEQKPVSAYRENVLERGARLVSRHATAIVLVLAYLLMRGLFILFEKR